MSDFVNQLVDEIACLKRQEEELHLKRSVLEEFLEKINKANQKEAIKTIAITEIACTTDSSPVLSPASKTTKVNKKSKSKRRVIQNTTPMLQNAIVDILSDGKLWRLVDIRKRLREHFGREIPSSSLRGAIKGLLKDKKTVESPEYGSYKLTQINTPENPFAAKS